MNAPKHNGNRYMILIRIGYAILPMAALCASCLILAGCAAWSSSDSSPTALGTNAVPSAFDGAVTHDAASWIEARPASHLPKGYWWRVFDDAMLNQLEEQASTNNQELAQAVARLAEARENVNITRAELFPQASFDPVYARERTSYNAPSGNGHPIDTKPTYNLFTLGLHAGWEADVWGHVRHMVEAAKAELAASAADLQSISLIIHAELATDYFNLRELDAECDVLQTRVSIEQHRLELIRNQSKGGIATDWDVAQAETQLQAVEATLPALQLERTQTLHAIATLCGKPATGFTIEKLNANTSLLPAIPAMLPSELLQRRPDIAAAEQRMAEANAQVGVAKTAFYPQFRLNGLSGLESVDLSTLLRGPSLFWSVGPSISLPIFTGGRNQAQLAQAHAAYDESLAGYRQTAIHAFQEVEDQLAAQRLIAAQIKAQTGAWMSAKKALDVVSHRYTGGLVTYLDVAAAQTEALNMERSLIQLHGQGMMASVSLIRALGGGWNDPAPEHPR